MRLLAALAAFGLIAMPSFGADIPRPAPALSMMTPNGSRIQLDQYKGKVVALEVMITTCPACQHASQVLNKIYTEYKDKGFQAVGVAINPMAHMLVEDFQKKFGVTFPIGHESAETVKAFLQHPIVEIFRVPQLVFIDKNGVIRGQYNGTDPFFNDEEKNIRAEVEKLLKEPARAGAKKAASSK